MVPKGPQSVWAAARAGEPATSSAPRRTQMGVPSGNELGNSSCGPFKRNPSHPSEPSVGVGLITPMLSPSWLPLTAVFFGGKLLQSTGGGKVNFRRRAWTPDVQRLRLLDGRGVFRASLFRAIPISPEKKCETFPHSAEPPRCADSIEVVRAVVTGAPCPRRLHPGRLRARRGPRGGLGHQPQRGVEDLCRWFRPSRRDVSTTWPSITCTSTPPASTSGELPGHFQGGCHRHRGGGHRAQRDLGYLRRGTPRTRSSDGSSCAS